jgi:hypothetical protein
VTTERIVRIVAGSFVLVSLALGVEGSPLFVSPALLWFTAFVGLNLLQSGLTRFCPLELVLRKAGVPGAAAPAASRPLPVEPSRGAQRPSRPARSISACLATPNDI